jgi:hypothetical protein
MEDQKDSNPVTEGLQTPDRQPAQKQFIPTVRRALSQALDLKGVREGLSSLDVRERKVPLEEITELRVAEIIDQNLYNPLRATMGQDKRLPFDVTHVLTNMDIYCNSDNYQQNFRRYRLSRIGFRLYH